MSRCTATREDGAPCRAHALSGEVFCFTHHPDRSHDREAARRAGGQARTSVRLPTETLPRALQTPRDVTALLSDAVGCVLRGELDARSANAVGYLCTVLLKAIQIGEMEERLARIEAAVRPGDVVGLADREFTTPYLLSEGSE